MRKISFLWGVLLIMIISTSAMAVTLPSVFTDHMVLQQGKPVAFWGTAQPDETVTVTIGETKTEVKADTFGAWKLNMPAMSATFDAFDVTVAGDKSDAIVVHDVLVGEVWLGSGQSNMEWRVKNCDNGEAEVAAANLPSVRLFQIPLRASVYPQPTCDAKWQVCTPETVPEFSAVLFFFGKNIQQDLNVPVGLINTSWGGTPCEAWTPEAYLYSDPITRPIVERWRDNPDLKQPWRPGALYNGMIVPVLPYTLKGFIWYQGESNIGRARQHETLFPMLIDSWRDAWNDETLPFGFVQLAPFSYDQKQIENGGTIPCAELRESQRLTVENVPNVGMVVTTDIGNVYDIHPRNKQTVGRRMALWAEANFYGKSDLVFSGPMFIAAKPEGDHIRISFKFADGLKTSDGKAPTHFEVAGADGQYVAANAVIEGDSIVASAESVKEPVFVRFGYRDIAEPNLFNGADLPASPFTSDTLPWLSEDAR
ncbi:MAG: sialate O-acetylesterase [Thermoguttaceae bacterium]|nr:sialate O-acetylesterase [Thermoguttaceae bacterium]